ETENRQGRYARPCFLRMRRESVPTSILDEVEIVLVVLVGEVRFAPILAEAQRIDLGEVGIAFYVGPDFGDHQAVGLPDQLTVEVGAADDEDARAGGRAQCGLRAGEYFGAGRRIAGVAADDQVAPPGKRPPERLPGLATHQQCVAERQRLEVR